MIMMLIMMVLLSSDKTLTSSWGRSLAHFCCRSSNICISLNDYLVVPCFMMQMFVDRSCDKSAIRSTLQYNI